VAKVDLPPRHRYRSSLRGVAALSVICLGLTIAAGVLTILAARQPVFTAPSQPGVALQQRASYTWTATMRDNRLYAGDTADDANLIYDSITKQLTLRFSYEAKAENATATSGTCGFAMTVAARDGWTKTTQLTAPKSISTSADEPGVARFSWSQRLSLADLARLIADVNAQTGDASSEYTVTVAPSLNLTASNGAASLTTGLEAPLVMTWRPDLRRLAMPERREFAPPLEETAPTGASLPNEFAIGTYRPTWRGKAISVVDARRWFGSLTAVGMVLSILTLLRRRRLRLQADPLRDRHRLERHNPGMFVTSVGTMPAGLVTVELKSLTDLVQTARLLGRPIIYVPEGDFHFVADGSFAYCAGRPEHTLVRIRPASIPARRRKRGPSSFGPDDPAVRPNQPA
jgi:hypothetical protein